MWSQPLYQTTVSSIPTAITRIVRMRSLLTCTFICLQPVAAARLSAAFIEQDVSRATVIHDQSVRLVRRSGNVNFDATSDAVNRTVAVGVAHGQIARNITLFQDVQAIPEQEARNLWTVSAAIDAVSIQAAVIAEFPGRVPRCRRYHLCNNRKRDADNLTARRAGTHRRVRSFSLPFPKKGTMDLSILKWHLNGSV